MLADVACVFTPLLDAFVSDLRIIRVPLFPEDDWIVLLFTDVEDLLELILLLFTGFFEVDFPAIVEFDLL